MTSNSILVGHNPSESARRNIFACAYMDVCTRAHNPKTKPSDHERAFHNIRAYACQIIGAQRIDVPEALS